MYGAIIMTWNIRVIKQTHPCGTVTHGLHEVHYNDDMKPVSCTVNTIAMSAESWDDLYDYCVKILRAFTQPALDMDKDFPEPVSTSTDIAMDLLKR